MGVDKAKLFQVSGLSFFRFPTFLSIKTAQGRKLVYEAYLLKIT